MQGAAAACSEAWGEISRGHGEAETWWDWEEEDGSWHGKTETVEGGQRKERVWELVQEAEGRRSVGEGESPCWPGARQVSGLELFFSHQYTRSCLGMFVNHKFAGIHLETQIMLVNVLAPSVLLLQSPSSVLWKWLQWLSCKKTTASTLHLKKVSPTLSIVTWRRIMQFLVILGRNISDTARHQMTVRFLTSPNGCFCTTWEYQNKRNMR